MKKLIAESIRISFYNTWVYKFEYIMMLVHVIFNLLFTIVFWLSVTNIFTLPNGYNQYDVYLFSALMQIADGIGECFFGIIPLPYYINEGELDMYLIRPQNTAIYYMLDNINIFSIMERFVVGFVFFMLVYKGNCFNNGIILIQAFLLLLVGVLIMQMIQAIISMSSFWFGIVDNFRSLITSVNEVQRYPMGIFSKSIRSIFTFIIPVSLITYYPFEILIGKIRLNIMIICLYIIIFIVVYNAMHLIMKKGLKHYESNN